MPGNQRFLDFIHTLHYSDVPPETLAMARRCLLDLIGVAAAGSCTDLSRIINRHSVNHFVAAGSKVSAGASLLFDGRKVSPVGAALANGMTIDSMDAHDGHKLTKGHVGCGVLPAALALMQAQDLDCDKEFLTCLVIGYELGTRAGMALHATASDYHTSGAWVSVACAALGARILGLNTQQSREAIGIAEYHGPRSQMMRTVDAPTMVKDGSGWGAMSGVSASYMAADGFTGAPALTVEAAEVSAIWADLGSEWLIHDQYFKLYPVCRWAQPAIEAALSVCREHEVLVQDIAQIEVTTFHAATRLATALPNNTEQAQYSLPYSIAAALVYGRLDPEQVQAQALENKQVQRLAKSMVLSEAEAFNQQFPAKRFAKVTIIMAGGQKYDSQAMQAQGDPEEPLSQQQIVDKYQSYTQSLLGEERSVQIQKQVDDIGSGERLSRLLALITAPIK